MKPLSLEQTKLIGYLESISSLAINILLFALKYWAGIVTGSVAIIADAWHTMSDSLSSLVVFLGTKYSTKPPDKNHPFGHGRIELVAAIIIGLLLAGVAVNLSFESIKRFFNFKSVMFNSLAYVVVVISILLKEMMAIFAIRAGKAAKLQSVVADGWHHRSDAITSLIVLVGITLGRYIWWIDSLLGLIVAGFIFYSAFQILKDTISPFLGEAPDPKLIEDISLLAQDAGVYAKHCHHFHIHSYGLHTELTFHVELPPDLSIKDGHQRCNQLEMSIADKHNIEATIHMEPYRA